MPTTEAAFRRPLPPTPSPLPPSAASALKHPPISSFLQSFPVALYANVPSLPVILCKYYKCSSRFCTAGAAFWRSLHLTWTTPLPAGCPTSSTPVLSKQARYIITSKEKCSKLISSWQRFFEVLRITLGNRRNWYLMGVVPIKYQFQSFKKFFLAKFSWFPPRSTDKLAL